LAAGWWQSKEGAMRGQFEKFTERARKALSLAQEEAQRLNHNYIAPIHILLGLAREGDGVAAHVLANLDVTYTAARSAVEQVLGRGQRIVLGEIGLTPAAKRVIEGAVIEARRLGHHYIGTEHLLLGLLRSDDETLADVWRTLNVTPDAMRVQTEQMLSQAPQVPESPEPTSQPPAAPQVARRAQDAATHGEHLARFDERARKVLSLAQEEAQRFNHNYIGTEHLLLGLVREGDGTGARVLQSLGVELNKVRSAVEFIVGRGDRIVLGEIGLTPRSKKVIELAVDEADRLNHNYIGTEHLLLGMIREGEGIAAGVLMSLGVSLEQVRKATIRLLQARGDGDTGESGPSDGDPPSGQD
jgi:ATP-dependent Clp protease ATP-binding subunit ClpA